MSTEGARLVLLACWLSHAAACTAPTFEREANVPASPDQPDARSTSPTSIDAGDASNAADADPELPPLDAAGASSSRADSSAVDDATAPEDAARDADASDDAKVVGAIPAWATPLLGRYAKRTIFFAYDSQIEMPVVTVERSLLAVSAAADGSLSAVANVCSYRGQWWDESATLSIVHPEVIPPIQWQIFLGTEPTFSTTTALQLVGFDPARQQACMGSTSAAKYPDQTWISGTACSCTTTPEQLPWFSRDCRLTDPDMDGVPGVQAKGGGVTPDTSIAISASYKMTGEVHPDREHRVEEQLTLNSTCVNDGCLPLGNPIPCFVVSELHPLDSDATCSTVLAMAPPIPALPVDECIAKGN